MFPSHLTLLGLQRASARDYLYHVPYFLIVCLVTLMGCGSVREPTKPVTEMVLITDSLRESVESGVRRSLKDPDSAIFGHMIGGRLPENENLLMVCGWVNAKNSFVGYVGDKPFVGLLRIGILEDHLFSVISIGSTDSSVGANLEQCAMNGLRL